MGGKEQTDGFVSKCTALLSHLPDNPKFHDTYKLDMIYSIVPSELRERLPRTDSENFQIVTENATSIENLLIEPNYTAKFSNELSIYKNKLISKCNFNKHFFTIRVGKFAARNQLKWWILATTCRNESTNSAHFAGYGCNTPGYVRSNRPKCTDSVSFFTSVSKTGAIAAMLLLADQNIFFKDLCCF